MQIQMEENETMIRVRVSGKLADATSADFEDRMREPLKNNPRDVVIDAGQLAFISSSGLRAFLALARELKKTGRRLSFENASADIARVLQMSGFSAMLNVQR